VTTIGALVASAPAAAAVSGLVWRTLTGTLTARAQTAAAIQPSQARTAALNASAPALAFIFNPQADIAYLPPVYARAEIRSPHAYADILYPRAEAIIWPHHAAAEIRRGYTESAIGRRRATTELLPGRASATIKANRTSVTLANTDT
jgi:hypothetical protein